jgi:hypothetical protein
MCGNIFNKLNHIDRKIVEFEIKKRDFLSPHKTNSTDFFFETKSWSIAVWTACVKKK